MRITSLRTWWITSAIALASYSPALAQSNQACGLACLFSTSGATGTGQSTFFDSAADYNFAQSNAWDDLRKNLGRQSGVVCAICPDGVQCKRTAATAGGSWTTSMVEIPGSTEETHGWSCTITYVGNYSVACAECID